MYKERKRASKTKKSYFESGKENTTEGTNGPISSVVKKIMTGACLSLMMETWYEHSGLMSLKTARLTITKVHVAPFSPNLMVSGLYQEPQKVSMGKKGAILSLHLLMS